MRTCLDRLASLRVTKPEPGTATRRPAISAACSPLAPARPRDVSDRGKPPPEAKEAPFCSPRPRVAARAVARPGPHPAVVRSPWTGRIVSSGLGVSVAGSSQAPRSAAAPRSRPPPARAPDGMHARADTRPWRGAAAGPRPRSGTGQDRPAPAFAAAVSSNQASLTPARSIWRSAMASACA
ncbi:hypothetical protein SPHS6_03733 [Sphingobium sp. S6]|nr:hypothetical protein SPHS6_03733 [Sphingobium sp. S6]CAD7341920.1 hypothetical protein SPHS8_03757 [Sphingobium sp. S8]